MVLYMNRLTDRAILEILNSYNIKINGIDQKDKLNKLLDGYIIINLQCSFQGFGTYWTIIYNCKDYTLYFESFGFLAPEAFEDKINK